MWKDPRVLIVLYIQVGASLDWRAVIRESAIRNIGGRIYKAAEGGISRIKHTCQSYPACFLRRQPPLSKVSAKAFILSSFRNQEHSRILFCDPLMLCLKIGYHVLIHPLLDFWSLRLKIRDRCFLPLTKRSRSLSKTVSVARASRNMRSASAYDACRMIVRQDSDRYRRNDEPH
jgi:hypothetical protein